MTNPNDAAFAEVIAFDNEHHLAGGLTKREYFAIHAMQSLISAGADTNWTERNFAIGGINMADALIAELNKAAKP